MIDLDYPRVAHAFYNQPHAILEAKLMEIDAFLQAKIRGGESPPWERSRSGFKVVLENGVLAWKEDGQPSPTAGPRPEYQVVDRTALIPVFGVLAQRMGLLEAFSGGTSTEAVGRKFDAALADRSVRSIVLVVDSPGGSVFGTAELANKIHAARGEKKVIAIADSLAASAAYWIASQAQELVVTPGGQVGSVGVVAAHQDLSKSDELKGVKTTYVHAGKYKVEGNPSEPLSAEARDHLQGMVDQYYAIFVKAVARGRGATESRVEKDFGQGRMRTAADAKEAGMVDRIATLEQVLQRLGADATAARNAEAQSRQYLARAAEIEQGA